MFLSEWREFPSAPCLPRKKLDESARLDVGEISHVPDMLRVCFLPRQKSTRYSLDGLRTYQHPVKYPLFFGRAKDLSAPM